MTLYQPATPYSDAILRPPCSKCGTKMQLARIEPDMPDHDRRTFECSNCQHSESVVVGCSQVSTGRYIDQLIGSGSAGALGRLLIGIPIVSDPRHTTGAAKPFLGVALRFKASKGDDAAAWKARL